eukprot:4892945-Pyramimonas_sp.AAC.1
MCKRAPNSWALLGALLGHPHSNGPLRRSLWLTLLVNAPSPLARSTSLRVSTRLSCREVPVSS